MKCITIRSLGVQGFDKGDFKDLMHAAPRQDMDLMHRACCLRAFVPSDRQRQSHLDVRTISSSALLDSCPFGISPNRDTPDGHLSYTNLIIPHSIISPFTFPIFTVTLLPYPMGKRKQETAALFPPKIKQ